MWNGVCYVGSCRECPMVWSLSFSWGGGWGDGGGGGGGGGTYPPQLAATEPWSEQIPDVSPVIVTQGRESSIQGIDSQIHLLERD